MGRRDRNGITGVVNPRIPHICTLQPHATFSFPTIFPPFFNRTIIHFRYRCLHDWQTPWTCILCKCAASRIKVNTNCVLVHVCWNQHKLSSLNFVLISTWQGEHTDTKPVRVTREHPVSKDSHVHNSTESNGHSVSGLWENAEVGQGWVGLLSFFVLVYSSGIHLTPKYWLGHPINYLLSLSFKKNLDRSIQKYILFDFEKGNTVYNSVIHFRHSSRWHASTSETNSRNDMKYSFTDQNIGYCWGKAITLPVYTLPAMMFCSTPKTCSVILYIV